MFHEAYSYDFHHNTCDFLSQGLSLRDNTAKCIDGQGLHLCFGLEMVLTCGLFDEANCGIRCSTVLMVI